MVHHSARNAVYTLFKHIIIHYLLDTEKHM
uniref:Uncharacterized protein n=1 Tax=Arundo donax TaxID=35708 RepID=A0A0A9CHF4_ARUDO